jgi:hypothetical protein
MVVQIFLFDVTPEDIAFHKADKSAVYQNVTSADSTRNWGQPHALGNLPDLIVCVDARRHSEN